MHIVVLDGYTLNPGDLSWEDLESMGTVTVYDRTRESQLAERCENAEILLTNKTKLSKETIDSSRSLRYIGVLATGYNVVDIDAAAGKSIPVTNIPTYGTTAVAQMVFAHLLEHCHHVKEHSDAVHAGRWNAQPDFCFWEHALTELVGKTMGIIGFGRIGQQVGILASAFGMKVIAYDVDKPEPPDSLSSFEWKELDEVFSESDVVTLHCPLLPQTEGMVTKEKLETMKPSALLINASRGGLVVDEDLADALKKGTIAGASLDVVSNTEPPDPDNPLLTAPNCLITPHIAWAAKEARQRLMDIAVDNISAFLEGTPKNVVNGVE